MTQTIRPPMQKRSQQSLERVLEASMALLEERGADAFTVQEVSQRADVSVGAIYARFGNKENLLRTVHRHAVDAMRDEFGAVSELDGARSENARDAILREVRALADNFHRNQKLLQAFMHLGAVDKEISRRGSAISTEIANQFESTVLAHRGDIVHSQPETAVGVAFRMAYCTFAWQVLQGPTYESDRAIPWSTLVDEVSDACATYLVQEPASK